MSIQTRCRRCGREFEADRAAILSGCWRLCPDCRDLPPPSRAPEPPSDRSTCPKSAAYGAARRR